MSQEGKLRAHHFAPAPHFSRTVTRKTAQPLVSTAHTRLGALNDPQMSLVHAWSSVTRAVTNGPRKTIRGANGEYHASYIDWSCATPGSRTTWLSSSPSVTGRIRARSNGLALAQFRLLDLPDDVVLFVFETYLNLLSPEPCRSGKEDFGFNADRLRAPLTLSAVCKRIRSLVSGTPGLWTYIVVPKLVTLFNSATLELGRFQADEAKWLALVQTQLMRSRGAHLNVCLIGILSSTQTMTSLGSPNYHNFYRRIFALIRDNLDRVRTLRIEAADVDPANLYGLGLLLGRPTAPEILEQQPYMSFRSLEQLEIRSTDLLPEAHAQVNIVAPRLRHLYIGNSIVPLLSMYTAATLGERPFRNLSRLFIDADYNFSMSIAALLHACGETLQHLRFNFLAPKESESRPGFDNTYYAPYEPSSEIQRAAIPLESLRTLSISVLSTAPEGLSRLLNQLQMPSLRNVILHDETRYASITTDWIINHTPSVSNDAFAGVTNLTLQVPGLVDGFSAHHGRSIGLSFPALKRLTFESSFVRHFFLQALRTSFVQGRLVQVILSQRTSFLITMPVLQLAWKASQQDVALGGNEWDIQRCVDIDYTGIPTDSDEFWLTKSDINLVLSPIITTQSL